MPSDLRLPTLRTDQLIDALLLDGRREERLKARLTQETGAVGHGDDLQQIQTEKKKKNKAFWSLIG